MGLRQQGIQSNQYRTSSGRAKRAESKGDDRAGSSPLTAVIGAAAVAAGAGYSHQVKRSAGVRAGAGASSG